MSKEKEFFERHIISLQNLTLIYRYIHNNAPLIEAEPILRAEYVLIISAFDNYLHQIVRKQIRDSFFVGKPISTDLELPMSVFQMINNEDDERSKKEILDSELRKVLEKDSYQSPRGVEYALNLINITKIWAKVSCLMGDSANNIKNRLSLIIKRRNQIAHEADIEYSTDSPRDIDEQTVRDCREFLLNLVTSIDSLIE